MTGRVLFIDDEPKMCELVRLDLTARGPDVVTCTSATEALRAGR